MDICFYFSWVINSVKVRENSMHDFGPVPFIKILKSGQFHACLGSMCVLQMSAVVFHSCQLGQVD